MPDIAKSELRQAIGERYLTFRIDAMLYALPVEEVLEIIHVPPFARVPQGPKSLLGIANLRGSVLPIASLRGLLGREEVESRATARALVLDGGAPVALAVDAVEALVSVAPDRVETRQAELSAQLGERLRGTFQAGSVDEVAKILDIHGILNVAFVRRERSQRKIEGSATVRQIDQSADPTNDQQMLVTFEVAGQEHALTLDSVQEVISAPNAVAVVAHSEALVLGITAYRETLLPLLSLRGLLGFQQTTAASGQEKVLVLAVKGIFVGLVVDRMRSIIRADNRLLEATPALLAARNRGEATVRSIYRGDGGRRLVSVLAPEKLFREDVMQRLSAGQRVAQAENSSSAEQRSETRQFLVFRLANDEFGLPIDAVDEVANVPDQITRLPKTPKFLEGVINLRGEVLPVVDQRRRFDMPKREKGERKQLIVVRSQRHRAGLIVDGVSEVLRVASDAIQPPPELTDETARLVHGVINLEKAGRIVLLLDPTELLSRAERGLLDKFEASVGQPDL